MNFLLYPLMKKAVGQMAKIALISLWISSLCSVIFLVIGVLFGQSLQGLSQFVTGLCGVLLLALLGLLSPWCHHVLLYRQGSSLTRHASCLNLVLAILLLGSALYTIVFNDLLLSGQALIAPLLLLSLGVMLCMNWAYMEVLSIGRRVSMFVFLLLIAVKFYFCVFWGPVYALGVDLGLLFLGRPLLQWLSRNAERIIALP